MVMQTARNQLRLQLIDDFSAIEGGREVAISSAPARLALGYLALCPGKTDSRAKLAAMIWEDSGDDHARRNLRQLLYNLRADFGGRWDGLEADRSTVILRPAAVVSDCEEIIETLRSGKVPDRIIEVQLIHERLLARVPEKGELFASWLHLKRKEFENILRSGLEKIMTGDNPVEAERAARASLSLDASDENASRYLIRLYADRGDTGRALGVYKELWDHLDEEYAMEPAPPTQELIAAVKSGERAPAQTLPKPVDPAKPSRKYAISVLPISAGDQADDAGRTGDLFRAELISRMVRFREIDVIDARVRKRPAEYNLMLMTVPTRGRFALISTLTRNSDGVVIWSDRYEQVSENWWEHQTKLAGKLAAACSLSLSRARLSEIAHLSAVGGAVDNWLLGQKLLNEFRSDPWERAAECYRKAIKLDPEFSMAYSSLSQLYNICHTLRPGIAPERSLHAESKAIANRAITLDPLDSRAHLSRAWASCLLREYAQSAASFSMARQCNDNDPWTVLSSALGEAFSGETELASELAARFLQEGWTSTTLQWGYHSNIRFLAADDEGCVSAAENAGDSILNIPAWKAAALWHLGERHRSTEAWGEFEAKIRAQWVANEEATTANILNWFLSCFPIRKGKARERLIEGASRAAESYAH